MKKKIIFLLFLIFCLSSCGKKTDPQYKESNLVIKNKSMII